MAAVSSSALVTIIVLVIGTLSNPSACHDFSKLSQLWEHMSAPYKALESMEDTLIHGLMELAELAQNTENLESDGSGASNVSIVNCTEDLITLARSRQLVKVIGGARINMSALALAIDAAGKPGAGIEQGSTIGWHGNLEECQLINVTMAHSSEMHYGYLTLTINSLATHRTVFGPLNEELCLPSSCDSSAVLFVLKLLNMTIVPRGTYLDPNPTKTGFNSLSMKGRPLFSQPGAVVMIAVCVFFLAMVLFGSLVDVLTSAIGEWMLKHKRLRSFSKDYSDPHLTESDRTPLLGRSKVANRFQTFLYELVTAFSLYKNVPMILATHQPPSAITSINGVRVISMFWVIMCHVYTFLSLGLIRNIMFLGLDVLPRFASQVIINGFFSVDSFFFLSGVLVSYLTLREMKRRNGKFPLVPYYLHRIIRLTPTYMFVLFFFWFLSMFLAQGTPAYQYTMGPEGQNWKNCKSYWFTNLLYINNFYPDKLNDECLAWSWYLANDMQFFVISPLIIIPLYLWFAGGLIASGVLLLVSFAITGFLTGFYNLPVSQFLAMTWGHISMPDAPNYFDVIYIKPYCRIGPYIIGLVLGAVFFYDFKPSLSRVKNWLIYLVLWAVAIAVGMSAVYGLYSGFQGRVFTGAENVLYNMFSRTGWGVALALMVYACHHGYGGSINSFLSMPFWIPLSRLTYTAYLVHPIVLISINNSERDSVYYTDVTMVVYIVGGTVLSYGVAAMVSAFVEFPVANVEMAVFKVLGIQLRESTRRVNMDGKSASVRSSPLAATNINTQDEKA